jgi:hypothetical protein
MIEQITKENPSFPITQSGMKLFRDYTINWSNLPQTHKHLVTEARVNSISNYSKHRFNTFKQILEV